MGITFTIRDYTGRINASELQDGEQEVWYEREEVRYEGCVLSIFTRSEHRYCDDMTNWEEITYARVWDGSKVIEVEIADMGCKSKPTTIDATDEVKTEVAEWEEFVAWIDTLAAAKREHESVVKEAQKIAKGKQVEVVKGRKVKKGTRWFVDHVGEGQYGAYANLSAQTIGRGEYHRYVSLDNLKVIGEEIGRLELSGATPYGNLPGTLLQMALDYSATYRNNYQHEANQTALSVLHDAFVDADMTPPPALVRLVKASQTVTTV